MSGALSLLPLLWTPQGRRAVLWARWSGVAHGGLISLASILSLIMLINEDVLDEVFLIPCLVFLAIFIWGAVVVLLSLLMGRRGRGPTIAAMTMALIISLPVTFYLAFIVWVLIAFDALQHLDEVEVEAWLWMALIVSIPLSGYFVTWNCITTLRRWPGQSGAAFQVEFVQPPTIGGGGGT
jgi:hypothetical protein